MIMNRPIDNSHNTISSLVG